MENDCLEVRISIKTNVFQLSRLLRSDLRWGPAAKGQQLEKWSVTFPRDPVYSFEDPWPLASKSCHCSLHSCMKVGDSYDSMYPKTYIAQKVSGHNCEHSQLFLFEVVTRYRAPKIAAGETSRTRRREWLGSRCNGCFVLWVAFVTLRCSNHFFPQKKNKNMCFFLDPCFGR